MGKLLDSLRELGLYETSLIIFYSDHGEHIFPTESVLAAKRGHGNSLSDELLLVPLIVKFPQRSHAGTRSNVPVQLADVFATVAAETKVTIGETQGIDLKSLIAAKQVNDRAIFSEYMLYGQDQIAVRRGDYKLVIRSPDRRELYDAQERLLAVNSKEMGERIRELELDLAEHERLADDQVMEANPLDVDSATLEGLRALGYVD